MSRSILSSVGQRIRAQVSDLSRGRRRRYPAALQRQIVSYAQARVREGVARSRVCAELGVSDPTLLRLLTAADAQAPRLRPVRIVSEPTSATAVHRLVVRVPGGIVVEGMDIAGVAALARALS